MILWLTGVLLVVLAPCAGAMLMPSARWLLRYTAATALLALVPFGYAVWSLFRPYSSGWGEGMLILLSFALVVSLFFGVGIRSMVLARRRNRTARSEAA